LEIGLTELEQRYRQFVEQNFNQNES